MVFTCLLYKTFEITVGKGEIARYEQFLLFHCVFYPTGELSTIFIKFLFLIKALTFWKSIKFVVWERVVDPKKESISNILEIEENIDFSIFFPLYRGFHLSKGKSLHLS